MFPNIGTKIEYKSWLTSKEFLFLMYISGSKQSAHAIRICRPIHAFYCHFPTIAIMTEFLKVATSMVTVIYCI